MDRPPLSLQQVQVQQLECLIILAEELHFGRTAARMGCSQSRVSQHIAALERSIGAQLVARTSRRVSLTRLGEGFVAEVRPAHRTLARTLSRARERALRGAMRELRVGFTGMVQEEIIRTFRTLREQHEIAVDIRDLPFGSPFTAVRSGEVDAVIAELPTREAELTVGFRFAPQDQLLAVGAGERLADRSAIDPDDLATTDLLHRLGDAPEYWKAIHCPPCTPTGVPIRSTTGIATLQEGLALVATGRFTMLVCRPVLEHNVRADIRFVPVRGLEQTSQLGLIWRSDQRSPALAALTDLLEAEATRVTIDAKNASSR